MPLPHISSTAASRLCTACGLCCNGVMFHTVRLQPNDAPRELAALGLKLKRKKGADCILQPCPAYRDAQCSIYAERPERCRLFECQQLKRVAAGEITEQTALEKIWKVQQRGARLDELSRKLDGSLRKGPLSKRCETALAEPFDVTTCPELVTRREELARGLAELDAMLDEDFRLPQSAAPTGDRRSRPPRALVQAASCNPTGNSLGNACETVMVPSYGKQQRQRQREETCSPP